MSLRTSSLVPCQRTSHKDSEPRKRPVPRSVAIAVEAGYLSASSNCLLKLMTRTSVAAYSRPSRPSYIGTYIGTGLRNASYLRDCHQRLQKTRCSPTPELRATLLPSIPGPLDSRGSVPSACQSERSRGISRGLTCCRGVGYDRRRKIAVGRNISRRAWPRYRVSVAIHRSPCHNYSRRKQVRMRACIVLEMAENSS